MATPDPKTRTIQLAHGGGGRLTAELIDTVILPALGGAPSSGGLTDAATLKMDGARMAFTTDTYVVQPLEFPGGDIGKLSICGTVNDLAVCGATPRAISLGLVIREGMEIAELRRLLESAGRTARRTGAAVVTGDTKVLGRTALEGLVINTAGVGEIMPGAELGFDRIQAGDRIVLSGALGEHGLAVMSRRENLSFSSTLQSDCAPLHELTAALIDKLGGAVRFMRDPTRGGLAATLVEIAEATARDLQIDEAAIPVNPAALVAAEVLGLDLLTVANEGKLVAIVAPEAADEAVAILATHDIARRAADIGAVDDVVEHPLVELATKAGGRRIIQMPYGEQLPRIC